MLNMIKYDNLIHSILCKTFKTVLKCLSINLRAILFSIPVFSCLVVGLPFLFTAESQAAPLKNFYLVTLDRTAVTFRCSEVIILVHNAVCKSNSRSCSSTQQIFC